MNKSIEDIYKGYLKKEFTPTEILNQYLTQINKVDKRLNSFTEVFESKVKKDSKRLDNLVCCLLYTSPSPRDRTRYRMPSSA